MRRVVTGHTADGTAVVVSDEELTPMAIGDEGAAATLVWGRDDAAQFPTTAGSRGCRRPSPFRVGARWR